MNVSDRLKKLRKKADWGVFMSLSKLGKMWHYGKRFLNTYIYRNLFYTFKRDVSLSKV